MTDRYCQIASHTWLFTSHGTVIFVDTTSGELRHGPLETNPPNVVLVREGERARLRFVGSTGPQEITCQLEYSAIVGSERQRSSETAATVGSEFTYVPTNGEEFGLTEHGQFLSAEPGGRMTSRAPRAKLGKVFIFEPRRLARLPKGSDGCRSTAPLFELTMMVFSL